MRTDDMNLVKNSIFSLVNLIRNMPFSGSPEQIQIDQILFLDRYYRDYISFETGIIEVENAKTNGNIELYNNLKNKYSYAYDNVGVFREKKVGDAVLSDISADILRRLGIQCNVVKGIIIYNQISYPHQWNEIKLNNKWYCYDFTYNLISEKWKDNNLKSVLKFIKLPVTPVDYSFVKMISKNARIIINDKNDDSSFKNTGYSDDFSKYTIMDRFMVLSEYSKIEKLSKAMNMEKN